MRYAKPMRRDAGLGHNGERPRHEQLHLQLRSDHLGGALNGHRRHLVNWIEAAEAFTTQAVVVDARDAGEGLDAALGHGDVDGVAATTADVHQHTDAAHVDVGQGYRVLNQATEILHGQHRVFNVAWLVSAGSLRTAIEGDDHEAGLGQRLAICTFPADWFKHLPIGCALGAAVVWIEYQCGATRSLE